MRGLRSTVATSPDPMRVSSSATILALIYAWGVDPTRKYVYHPNTDTDIPVIKCQPAVSGSEPIAPTDGTGLDPELRQSETGLSEPYPINEMTQQESLEADRLMGQQPARPTHQSAKGPYTDETQSGGDEGLTWEYPAVTYVDKLYSEVQ